MQVRTARLRACAKVNLSLKVLDKRPDGFHEIRTVFQTIGLADVLEVSWRPGRRGAVTLEGMPDVPPEENLIWRAARTVLEATHAAGRLAIRVSKNIPLGGGLGGGSSDAAAMLLALPALTGRGLSWPELMALGARLGSDVPFFLAGGTALGLGRGEEIYPLPDFRPFPVLVIAPDVHVSTPQAYRMLERGLTALPDLSRIGSLQSLVWAGGTLAGLENDFEAAVFGMYPELGRIRERLVKLGAPEARLSGSGAALFGVFPDRVACQRALHTFRAEHLRVFPTTMVTRAQYRAGWLRTLKEHCSGQVWPPQSRYSK